MGSTCKGTKNNCINNNDEVNAIFENNYNRQGMACDYESTHHLLFIAGGYDSTKEEFCRKSEG